MTETPSTFLDPPNANEQTVRLRWGLQPPASALRAWGARAVYGTHTSNGYFHVTSVDIVGDRQDFFCVGETGTEDHGPDELSWHSDQLAHGEFIQWAQRFSRSHMAAELERLGVGPESERTVEMERLDGPFRRVLKASPRRSFGYLFLVAYELP